MQSVRVILQILRSSLTFGKNPKIYHDLDYLAGTWCQQDLIEFNRNTSNFETIDKDLWL